MKIVAQYTFLVLLSSVIVTGGAMFWAWRDVIGLDTYTQSVKYFNGIAVMVVGVLGLTLAGDKAFITTGFWIWIRNSALQNKTFLWSANFLALCILLTVGFAWSQTRQITVFSDESVMLMNIDDVSAPETIGYLSGGQERTVLIKRGRSKIGYRVVGSKSVGTALLPTQADALGEYIFIRTKGAEDGAEMLLPEVGQ